MVSDFGSRLDRCPKGLLPWSGTHSLIVRSPFCSSALDCLLRTEHLGAPFQSVFLFVTATPFRSAPRICETQRKVKRWPVTVVYQGTER